LDSTILGKSDLVVPWLAVAGLWWSARDWLVGRWCTVADVGEVFGSLVTVGEWSALGDP
jgi:hypothetical protein